MTAATDIAELASAMSEAEDADACAAAAVEAAIEVFTANHSAAWTFNLFADMTDKLAWKAAQERDQKFAELRRKYG